MDTLGVDWLIFHGMSRRPDGSVDTAVSSLSIEDDSQDQDGVYQFVAGHISNGLKDGGARAVAFAEAAKDVEIADPNETIPDAIAALLGEDDPVDASQQLAAHLQKLLEGDARISGGNLAVAAFHESDGARRVAVLKLDPAPQFRLEKEASNGGIRLAPVKIEGVLPSNRERLQKAAFFDEVDGLTHITAIDRQAPRDEIATWFLADFIGAEEVETDATRTRAFYRAANKARATVEEHLDFETLLALDQARDQALRDQTVDANAWLAARPELAAVPTEARKSFEDAFDNAITDRQFNVDRGTADRYLKKATFTGDNGLVIHINSDFRQNVKSLEQDDDGESFVRIYTDTLHAQP